MLNFNSPIKEQKKYNDLQDEIFNYLEKSDKEHWKDFCLNCDRGL